MQFGDDERAAAIQIGAVLLFAMLIISMAVYQANVVPNQNKGIEFNHNQEVQGQMQDLRNAVVSVPGGGSGGSVTVDLGTTYPSRTLFVNPGPPSGTLRTVGTNSERVNVSVVNATATGETGDFWNGDARNFTTGALVYEPNYHEYQNPPTTVYEHSLLYNQFRDANLTVSDQTIVNNRQITLVTLDGNLSENGMDSASVTARPISASSNTVAVEADSGPINITVPTRLDNDTWSEALRGQYVSNGGHVAGQYYEDVSGQPYGLLTIELEEGETYDLQMARVGVGSGASEVDSELYMADPEIDGTIASAEVRDRYSNPVGETNVTVYVDGTETTTEVSNTDGRVSYDANAGDTVKFSIGTNASENVTVTVPDSGENGNDSSAYQIDWQNPADNSTNDGLDLSNCSDESCTWDVGASGNDEMALTGLANDQIENVDVDFRVNNSTVGQVSPQSDSDTGNGRVWTNLTANENGTVGVYVLSSGSSDVIDIEIINATSGGGSTNLPPTADFVYSPTNPTTDESVTFDGSNSADSDGTIESYEWDLDGDGTIDQTGEVVATSYDSPGSYDVTLTVTDNDSATDSVTRTVTVSRKPLITAVQPDPERMVDSDGEFIRVNFSQSTDTTNWVLRDGDSGQETTLPAETLDGEVYFARNPDQFSTIWGIDNSSVYGLDTELANTGGSLELVDDTGAIRDEFGYNGSTTSNGWSVPVGPGEVAYRLQSSGSYVDSDSESDWSTEEAHTFFGATPGPGIAFKTTSTGALATVDLQGQITEFAVEEPQVLGPMSSDLDGDGSMDLPYVNQSGFLRTVDVNNNTETLVDPNSDGVTPSTGTRLGVGTYRGSNQSVFFVNSNGNLYRAAPGEAPEPVYEQPGKNQGLISAQAVAGTGDFDGDGANEILIINSNQEIAYVNHDTNNGKNEVLSTGEVLNTVSALSPPGDLDADGALEVAFNDGSAPYIQLADQNGYESDVTDGTTTAQEAPLGLFDWNGDGAEEVIYVDGSGDIRYVTQNGNVGYVVDEDGNRITATVSTSTGTQ